MPLAPEFNGTGDKLSYKIGKAGKPAGDLTGTDFEAIKANKYLLLTLFWDMTNLSKTKGTLPDV